MGGDFPSIASGGAADTESIADDADASSYCDPGFDAEVVKDITDDTVQTITTSQVGALYHLSVEPSAAGDRTFVQLKCGGDPTADSFVLSSSDGPYPIRTKAQRSVRVKRYNLTGTFSFKVRFVRVN